MPLRDANPPQATGARAILDGDSGEADQAITCAECGSADVGAVWRDGVLVMTSCRACAALWARPSGD